MGNLCLSRKTNERIIIDGPGCHIVMRVCGVRGDEVRLAFDAPEEVRIWREEVLNRIERTEPCPT